MDINSISSLLKFSNNINIYNTDNTYFSDILNLSINADEKYADNLLKTVFGNMNIVVNTGKFDVSSALWSRTDFPVWNLFNKTDIGKISRWVPSGKEPNMSDSIIQNNLGKIGKGVLSIIIPDNVYEKMQTNNEFAFKVINNISEWKNKYDINDNTIAEYCGANIESYQSNKSYCITLDENGDVENHAVISQSFENNKYVENKSDIKKKTKSDLIEVVEDNVLKVVKSDNKNSDEISLNKYVSAMEFVATSFIKDKINV